MHLRWCSVPEASSLHCFAALPADFANSASEHCASRPIRATHYLEQSKKIGPSLLFYRDTPFQWWLAQTEPGFGVVDVARTEEAGLGCVAVAAPEGADSVAKQPPVRVCYWQS